MLRWFLPFFSMMKSSSLGAMSTGNCLGPTEFWEPTVPQHVLGWIGWMVADLPKKMGAKRFDGYPMEIQWIWMDNIINDTYIYDYIYIWLYIYAGTNCYTYLYLFVRLVDARKVCFPPIFICVFRPQARKFRVKCVGSMVPWDGIEMMSGYTKFPWDLWISLMSLIHN